MPIGGGSNWLGNINCSKQRAAGWELLELGQDSYYSVGTE